MATPTVETKIWLAIKARIDTLSLSQPHTTIDGDRPETLPNGMVIEVMYRPNRPQRRYLDGGDPPFRQGFVQLGLMFRPGDTSRPHSQEMAGDIAGHFPADLPMRYGGITVKVSEAPEVGGGFLDDERQRFVTPITVRWKTEA
ncbi:DUF4128 domain-containing protein [Pelagibacterium sp. 26DY04]|uniref:phage tail terminator-like protein n=1 Tax=Pelagibacterium sp. 26DY04 TaxID=2967130 RepID=UPI0028167952|nr:phage tail terminator-like protein [Pelagibacterium sp. 26DY04]WMT85566.1 DUF4128 domain-containing protein [Pelagibacterium sp. 26DY04]